MEGRDKQRRVERKGDERRGERRNVEHKKLAVTCILASTKSHSETKNEMKKRRKAAVDLRGKERSGKKTRGRGERRYVEDKKAKDGSHATLQLL